MPLSAFWCLYKKIDQLQAAEDLHTIALPGFGTSKEQYEKFINEAVKVRGHPVIYDTSGEKLDREGLNRLRRIR